MQPKEKTPEEKRKITKGFLEALLYLEGEGADKKPRLIGQEAALELIKTIKIHPTTNVVDGGLQNTVEYLIPEAAVVKAGLRNHNWETLSIKSVLLGKEWIDDKPCYSMSESYTDNGETYPNSFISKLQEISGFTLPDPASINAHAAQVVKSRKKGSPRRG